MAIEVSLTLHGTPYGELGWAERAPSNLSPDVIRHYADDLSKRLHAVAGLMDTLYQDGWTSQANSFDLAFTKAGIESEEEARRALTRLGIAEDQDLVSIQPPPSFGEGTADTYRFFKALHAEHVGEGSARQGELVVPSVFSPEMVGADTLLPASRAVVVDLPSGTTAHAFAERVWQVAHGGLDVPPVEPGYVDVVFEFLSSVEDIETGTPVGFSTHDAEHHHHEGCDHAHS